MAWMKFFVLWSMGLMPPFSHLYGWLDEYFDTYFISLYWDHSLWMIHYVGEFSTKCFEDLQSPGWIMSCNHVMLNYLALPWNECVNLVDDESIITMKVFYLISLRSSYSSLQYDKHRVMQVYYPYRFFWQFGHPQDVLEGLLEVFFFLLWSFGGGESTLGVLHQAWYPLKSHYTKLP